MTGLQEFACLAQEATDAVARREAQFPALIASGKIAAEQAALETRVWQAIAADWQGVVAGTRPDGPSATIEEKIAALEESLRRCDVAMRKAYATAESGVRQAWDQNMTLHDIAQRFGDAAQPLLVAFDRHGHVADMLKWQRRELPGSDRQQIGHFIEQRQRLLRERKFREAA